MRNHVYYLHGHKQQRLAYQLNIGSTRVTNNSFIKGETLIKVFQFFYYSYTYS